MITINNPRECLWLEGEEVSYRGQFVVSSLFKVESKEILGERPAVDEYEEVRTE